MYFFICIYKRAHHLEQTGAHIVFLLFCTCLSYLYFCICVFLSVFLHLRICISSSVYLCFCICVYLKRLTTWSRLVPSLRVGGFFQVQVKVNSLINNPDYHCQVPVGIAQFRYLMVCHAVFCLNQANISVSQVETNPSFIVFSKLGRRKANIENADRQCVLSQVKPKSPISFYLSSLIQSSTSSFLDGVVAACSSLGLDGVSRGRRRLVFGEFQVNWEINYRTGSSSVAFLRCMGQEETFRWPYTSRLFQFAINISRLDST